MKSPSRRSRSQTPNASNAEPQGERGPSEKKHKNMSEVRATGRQSDQGGRPGGTRRSK